MKLEEIYSLIKRQSEEVYKLKSEGYEETWTYPKNPYEIQTDMRHMRNSNHMKVISNMVRTQLIKNGKLIKTII